MRSNCPRKWDVIRRVFALITQRGGDWFSVPPGPLHRCLQERTPAYLHDDGKNPLKGVGVVLPPDVLAGASSRSGFDRKIGTRHRGAEPESHESGLLWRDGNGIS